MSTAKHVVVQFADKQKNLLSFIDDDDLSNDYIINYVKDNLPKGNAPIERVLVIEKMER